VITIDLHQDGHTRLVDRIAPEWLVPHADVTLWFYLADADPEESHHILAGTFHFHELAVEDAITSTHHPKVEPYDGYRSDAVVRPAAALAVTRHRQALASARGRHG